MKKFIQKIKLSKNKKNIAKITSGTLVGQLISLISLPILARLYGVEVFGTWALITALAMIISSYSDLGMSNLIMIEKREILRKTYKVVSTITIFLSLISSLLLTFLYSFFSDDILISPYLFFIILFLTSFLSQQVQICYTWLNRNEKYDVLMRNPIINYSIYGISGIILGLLGFVYYGFFVAHILGSLFTLYNMKKHLPKGMFTFDYKEIFEYLTENRKFSILQLPTNITNNVKIQTPTLLIGLLWGAEILGYYSITLRILQMPVILIAKSIGRVFFQVVSEMKRKNMKIGDYVLRNVNKAMKIAIVPMILLVGFGDTLTEAFLGEQWDVAGDFVRILAIQYFFMFLQSSMQGLAITLDKQQYALMANTLQILCLIAAIFIGTYYFESIYIALLLASVLTILVQLVYFVSLFNVMKVSSFKYLKRVVISISIILVTAFSLRELFNYVLKVF
jgi:O-antigen/teichoic acid export membrane protein